MTDAENTPKARKAKADTPPTAPTAELAAEPARAPAYQPTVVATQPRRRIGTGIRIGAIAASLVGGLLLGGAGGFALAGFTHHRGPVAEQGSQQGGQPGNQHGPGQGMPGQPPQGGPQGGQSQDESDEGAESETDTE